MIVGAVGQRLTVACWGRVEGANGWWLSCGARRKGLKSRTWSQRLTVGAGRKVLTGRESIGLTSGAVRKRLPVGTRRKRPTVGTIISLRKMPRNW